MTEDKFWNRLQTSRLNRRRLLSGAALGGAGLAAAAVIGCGGDDEEEATTEQPAGGQQTLKRGSVTQLTAGAGQTLSPNSTALWATEYFAIYDQLARVGVGNVVEPALATKWELANPNRWVFHLRDAQFSDGKPVTAEDVKFTFDYIGNPDNKSSIISRVDTVASVDIIDAKTVAINTKNPDPILPRKQFFVHIMPKHILGDPTKGDTEMATKPIGSGAYVIEEYGRGARIKMKANPNSWRGTKGVDVADMQIITDAQTQLAAYEAGQGDMAGVNLQDVQRTAAIKNSKIFTLPATGYSGYDMEYFDAPYNDLRVRMAHALAADRNTIKKVIYFDQYELMQGQYLSKPTFGWNPNIQEYKYDPDEARRLLKQAGVDKLSVKMEYSGTGTSKTMSEAMADYFKEIGVTVELVPIDVNVWRDGLYGRRKRATFMTNSWSSSAILEASIAFQWMHSPNPGKFFGNKDFDAAYEAAIKEPDDEKRKALYQKAGQVLHDDPPGLWIVAGAQQVVYRTDKIKDLASIGAPPIYFDSMLLA